MPVPSSLRHLTLASALVLSVLVAGVLGYMAIEHLCLVDALYTTIETMATLGGTVRPLTPSGRLFTIVIIIFGVGSLLYTFGSGMEYMIEGHFNQAIRRYLMDKKIAALHHHAILCGFGRVGSQIAEDFAAAQTSFVVIDENEGNVQQCLHRGYLALQGDATHDELLREAGIEQAQGILVATDNDAHNISITLSARHLNGKLFIISRANQRETEAKLMLAGANRVLSPYTISGHRMANLALQPTVIEFFDSMTKAGSLDLAVQEITLVPTSPLIGKTMAEAQNTLTNGIAIIALKKRNGVISGPRLQTCLEEGDTLIVVGVPEHLATLRAQSKRKGL